MWLWYNNNYYYYNHFMALWFLSNCVEFWWLSKVTAVCFLRLKLDDWMQSLFNHTKVMACMNFQCCKLLQSFFSDTTQVVLNITAECGTAVWVDVSWLLQQSIEAETVKGSEALKKSLSTMQDRLKAVSKSYIVNCALFSPLLCCHYCRGLFGI